MNDSTFDEILESKVITLREEKKTYKQIAEKLGIKFNLVRKICEQNKINKAIKQTNIEEVFLTSIQMNGYKLLTDYKNTTTKVKLLHLNCGNVWEVQPRSYNQGSRCPDCGYKKRLLTHSDFISEMKRMWDNQYAFLTEYKNSNMKIKVKCNKCGHVKEDLPSNLLKRKCLGCSLEEKRKERELIFIKEIKEKIGSDYTLISEYKTNTVIVTLKHSCGYEYNVHPSSIKKYARTCPMCTNVPINNEKDFIERLKRHRNSEYELVGEFKGMSEFTTFKHSTCGGTFEERPNKIFIRKTHYDCRCETKQLHEEKINKREIFKQELIHSLKEGFVLLSEYEGAEKKVKIQHICGHIYETKASHVKAGHGCPRCAGLYVDTEIVKQKIKEAKGDEYEVVSEYVNAKTEMTFLHKRCDTYFNAKHYDVISLKVSCPKCKETRGEEKIRYFLEKNGIDFIPQYKDERCRNKRALRFDFACFSENVLLCLIEFDGLQHDYDIEFFGGKKGLAYRVKNDLIKEEFCQQNNIPLLRIKYKDINNIDDILRNELVDLKILESKQLTLCF